MPEIYKLNLPPPSGPLIALLEDLARSTALDIKGKKWLDEQNHSGNSAEHLFFMSDPVTEMVQQEFGMYFQAPIMALVGIMRSSDGKPANQPPHTDRARALAINYFVQLGGDHVTTTFYDIVERPQLSHARNFTYQEARAHQQGSVVFEQDNWYAFDVCRCHSIENITSTRLLVSIILREHMQDYTAKDLARDHPNLIAARLLVNYIDPITV